MKARSKNFTKHLVERFRVTDGEKFKLKNYAPDDLAGHDVDKTEADRLLADGVARLTALQDKLAAQNEWALLISLQGMDAGGKDGTIKHVMSGVNPQGVQVTSFKQPSAEELSHDFLWRTHRAMPERGKIGIHNRSHYEEVLVCRVHPELLENQRLPKELREGSKFWKHRLEDIAHAERYMARQGTVQLKFFLHLSKDEQKRRFLSRIDTPAKNWKFSMTDLKERGFWNDYQTAYEEAIQATAKPHSPWIIVPADHKWFAHLVVVESIVDALEQLNLKLPSPPPEECARLQEARAKLEAE
jgi:PPK2 family polyphosphate:nucleotide phosphotransferase